MDRVALCGFGQVVLTVEEKGGPTATSSDGVANVELVVGSTGAVWLSASFPGLFSPSKVRATAPWTLQLARTSPEPVQGAAATKVAKRRVKRRSMSS